MILKYFVTAALLIDEKVASGATLEDAEALAEYAGFVAGHDRLHRFCAGSRGVKFAVRKQVVLYPNEE